LINPTDEFHGGDDDPIAAAFANYTPAPRDVVPRQDRDGIAELDIDAMAGTTQQIRYYEMTEDGVTEHIEHAIITAPITNLERNIER